MRRGFSLLETIVYIGVLGLLFAALAPLLLWSLKAHTKASSMAEVNANTARIVAIMSSEIREAESVYTPTSTLSQLSLETTRDVPFGETDTFIDFFLCGEQICLKREGSAPVALTSPKVRVTKFEFSQFSSSPFPPSVQVVFRIEHQNPQERAELSSSAEQTFSVSLRNY